MITCVLEIFGGKNPPYVLAKSAIITEELIALKAGVLSLSLNHAQGNQPQHPVGVILLMRFDRKVAVCFALIHNISAHILDYIQFKFILPIFSL